MSVCECVCICVRRHPLQVNDCACEACAAVVSRPAAEECRRGAGGEVAGRGGKERDVVPDGVK